MEKNEQKPITTTITFLNGERARRYATHLKEQQERLSRCNDILLHIPHSSTRFPEHSNHNFEELNEEERELIDYYIDELFQPSTPMWNIHSIIYPYCRLYCDVERLLDDPLEKYGLGFHYEYDVKDEFLPLIGEKFCSREDSFKEYVRHHSEATLKICELSKHRLLMIDCHSFSSRPTILNETPSDVDICIGFNDDRTKPYKGMLDRIIRFFEEHGYKVSVNSPFSNSKTFPVSKFFHYSSVMIEVNKRLYMNEDTLEKTEGFLKLRQNIQSLYSILLRQM